LLAACVALYLAASIAVGLYASRRVRGAADFAVARGRFSTPIITATVFATWFGAETVLGIPATFMKEGLSGLVADPFAAVGCLVVIGLVFARALFRLSPLTLGDYFRARFGRPAEVDLTLCIAFSYFGWVAAQFVALGLAFNVLSGGAIDLRTGVVLGAGAVLIYTVAGGMWSVALTDFLQAVVIILGLAGVAWVVADLAGGAGRVIESAAESGRLRALPAPDLKSILAFISAGLVVLLGSIPQQDVLQRIVSARDEKAAASGAILGGILYLCIALVPIFLVSAAALIDAPMVDKLIQRDHQLILPTLILERTPFAIQVLFFGALISAILSTASGALLAPAVMLAENLIRPLAPGMGDAALLRTMRLTVLGLGAGITAMALTSSLSIYQLVNESGKVVLVAAFVPLAAGLFWPRATGTGALVSSGCGLGAWLVLEALAPDGMVPPPLAGLLASATGMAIASAFRPAFSAFRRFLLLPRGPDA
jgi:Na+/proline symporter